MSLLEAPALVLAGVLPDREDRLHRVVTLPAGVFSGDDARIFALIYEYAKKYNRVLPAQTVQRHLLRGRDSGDLHEELVHSIASRWQALVAEDVENDRFEWAYSTALEDWQMERARAALFQAGEVLIDGKVMPDPKTGKDRRRQGYQDMRDVLAFDWSEIDKWNPGAGASDEGELSEEFEALLADIGSHQEAGRAVRTSIDPLDVATSGGPRLRELWFVAAYAGDGKTTFSTSVVSYQAVLQGLNVVYLTGETGRDVVRRRFVVRHTRHPMFGLPGGVDVNAVKTGALTGAGLEVYQAASQDLVEGIRDGRYGRFFVQAMPLRNQFDQVQNTLTRLEARYPVHVLVVDSIDMIRTPRPGWSPRDQLNESIETFKSLAITHAGGRGLIVVSPYQIKRASYEEALANSGRYELSALSETAMAERRADVVLSLLRLPEQPSQIRCQLLKNRDGPKVDFPLEIDDRSAYMGASSSASASFASVDLLS